MNVVLTRDHSMLGVMTMNIGYFLSILAGVFVGELFVGRYAHAGEVVGKES